MDRRSATRSVAARSWAHGAPTRASSSRRSSAVSADESAAAHRRRRAPTKLVKGFRHALRRCRAYDAVMRPVEGIDPHRACARSPEFGRSGSNAPSLVEMLERAGPKRDGAMPSRARPTSCRCCAKPEVVDAGGKGLTLLLDALLEVVDGRPIPEPEIVDTLREGCRAPRRRRRRVGTPLRGHVLPRRRGFHNHGLSRDVGRDRRFDRSGRRWRRHLELPCPHQRHRRCAVEAGIDAGRPHLRSASPTCSSKSKKNAACARPKVVADDSETASVIDAEPVTTAVVRGRCMGNGILPAADESRRATGRGRRSVAEPVDRADSRGGRVVHLRLRDRVLPNNKNIVAVARVRSIARFTDKHVAVVATTSVPEAARRASSSTTRTPSSRMNEATMSSAARTCAHRPRSTQAVRDTVVDAGQIRKGVIDQSIARRGDSSRAPARAADAVRELPAALVEGRQRDRHRARRRGSRR